MNIKCIAICFFVLAVAGSDVSAADFINGKTTPTDPIDIEGDLCDRFPCLAGCAPLFQCNLKSAELDQLIKPQAGFVVNHGELSYVANSSKTTTYLTIDFVNGISSFTILSNGISSQDEYYFQAFDKEMIHQMNRLGALAYTSHSSRNRANAGGCSGAVDALIGALQAYAAARATGNASSIEAAFDNVQVAFSFFLTCHAE